ncbi:hypothetical protein [Chryseobacterium gregarium]|uniref:hypothetical protein n=1 Tax=Chryseobacterium gregarium TaxID=456299 RepID=UPI00048A0494|nr:hypothetical protein [Chryseobacterium gregarium]
MDTPRKKMAEGLKENNSNQEIIESDDEFYNFLDRNLEKESTNSFSSGFSKNIIRKVEAKQQRRFNMKICILISILLVITIPMFVSFLSTDFILMLASAVSKHKFTFIFLILAVILIQLGEKLIISKKDLHRGEYQKK